MEKIDTLAHRLSMLLDINAAWLMGYDVPKDSSQDPIQQLEAALLDFVKSPGLWHLNLPNGFEEFNSLLEKLGYVIVPNDNGEFELSSGECKVIISSSELLDLARTSIASITGITQSLIDKKTSS